VARIPGNSTRTGVILQLTHFNESHGIVIAGLRLYADESLLGIVSAMSRNSHHRTSENDGYVLAFEDPQICRPYQLLNTLSGNELRAQTEGLPSYGAYLVQGAGVEVLEAGLSYLDELLSDGWVLNGQQFVDTSPLHTDDQGMNETALYFVESGTVRATVVDFEPNLDGSLDQYDAALSVHGRVPDGAMLNPANPPGRAVDVTLHPQDLLVFDYTCPHRFESVAGPRIAHSFSPFPG